MRSSGSAERRGITWGVDGHGVRHYVCANCEKPLGVDEEAAKCLECDRVREKAALIGTRYGGNSPCHSILKAAIAFRAAVTAEEAAAAGKQYNKKYNDRFLS